MTNNGCKRYCEVMNRPAYIVLFKGDDSDFEGNQSVDIVIDTELDTTGMKAHFRFMDFVQDFDSIPENKTLSLVFPNAKTSEFPLGAADATLRFEDASGKFRTISNRIHIVVTNSVHEAYDNEDGQSITVTVKGTVTWEMIQGKPTFATVATSGSYNDLTDKPEIPAPITIDPALSPISENPVQNKAVAAALVGKRGVTDLGVRGVPEGEGSWFTVNGEVATWVSFGSWRSPSFDISRNSGGYALDVADVYVGSFVLDSTFSSRDIEGYVIVGYVDTLAKESQIPPVPTASTATPKMDSGNGAAGASAQFARGDHVHPSDTAKLDGAAAYPAWEDDAYTEGYIVSYKGKLYRAEEDVYSGDAPPDVNTAWSETNLDWLKQDALSSAQMNAVNSGATAAKVAAWDGYAAQIAQKANASDLPYAMVTPGEWEFSGLPNGVTAVVQYAGDNFWGIALSNGDHQNMGAGGENAMSVVFPASEWMEGIATYSVTATRASLPGHLLDRAGNRVVVSGDTTLTLPALVNAGKLRDFLVRLEISGSTVPTITFQGQGSEAPNGADEITYETDGDEFPVPDEAGDWLYSFTESCVAHKFAVSLKKVNEVAAPQTQGGS